MTKPNRNQVTLSPYAVLVMPNPAGGFNCCAPSFPEIFSVAHDDPYDALYAMYEAIAVRVADYPKEGRKLPPADHRQPRALVVSDEVASLLSRCAFLEKISEAEMLGRLLQRHHQEIMSRFKPRKVVKLPQRKPAARKTAKHAAKRTNGRKVAATA